MTRALVLGGGGAVGVAWEVGVLAGLIAGGVDLTGAHDGSSTKPDLILGTSAGSIVGALMTTHGIDQLMELAVSSDSSSVIEEVVPLLDFAAMAETFGAWQNITDQTPENLAKVCALAAATNTISEDRWVGSMAEFIDSAWPDHRFQCVAVDTATGNRVVWSHEHGVETPRAVASSCSVPSIFPSVTIHSGGVTSRYTSIDLAVGHDRIVVLAPIGSWAADSLDASAARSIAAETKVAEAAGRTVLTMFTDDTTNQATLTTPLGRMDPAARQPALDHGIRQGKELADRLSGWW
jgi:NTE family protein